MLRTQYRCHPVISDLANSLFYQGQLLDGIQGADREPVLVKLITFLYTYTQIKHHNSIPSLLQTTLYNTVSFVALDCVPAQVYPEFCLVYYFSGYSANPLFL